VYWARGLFNRVQRAHHGDDIDLDEHAFERQAWHRRSCRPPVAPNTAGPLFATGGSTSHLSAEREPLLLSFFELLFGNLELEPVAVDA
jgi:hypothetical protein